MPPEDFRFQRLNSLRIQFNDQKIHEFSKILERTQDSVWLQQKKDFAKKVNAVISIKSTSGHIDYCVNDLQISNELTSLLVMFKPIECRWTGENPLDFRGFLF